MRIVVGTTDIEPETVAALDATRRPWETVELTEEDSYWQMFSDLWDAGESFTVVEHDIVIRPDTIDELEKCTAVWCAFGYPYIGGSVHYGLGCTKFTAEAIRQSPGALHQVAPMCDTTHPPKHWCRLDAWLCQHVLPKFGLRPHYHMPPVGHISDGRPSHNCI